MLGTSAARRPRGHRAITAGRNAWLSEGDHLLGGVLLTGAVANCQLHCLHAVISVVVGHLLATAALAIAELPLITLNPLVVVGPGAIKGAVQCRTLSLKHSQWRSVAPTFAANLQQAIWAVAGIADLAPGRILRQEVGDFRGRGTGPLRQN